MGALCESDSGWQHNVSDVNSGATLELTILPLLDISWPVCDIYLPDI